MVETKKQGKRSFTPEFKEGAVKLARELGNVSAASRQLGVVNSLLRNWITSGESARMQGKGLAGVLEERDRVARLERENAILREEVEILKKATAYFSASHHPRNTPGSKPTVRSTH